MTVSWDQRAREAEHFAKLFRVIAVGKPMRTYERKRAFEQAKRHERDAAFYRSKMKEADA